MGQMSRIGGHGLARMMVFINGLVRVCSRTAKVVGRDHLRVREQGMVHQDRPACIVRSKKSNKHRIKGQHSQ